MIKVYAADIQKLQDPIEHPSLLDELTMARQEKIRRCQSASGRIQSLGAGLLLKKILEEYQISQDQIRIGEHGKPEAEGFCFNLSHTNGFVICAVGERPVGCDAEKIKKAPAKIARRYFTANECSYLERWGQSAYDETFFRIWTAKEAYLKMTGEGLGQGLDQIEIRLQEDGVSVWRDGRMAECHVKEYHVPGYQVTVCAEEEDFSEKIFFRDLY